MRFIMVALLLLVSTAARAEFVRPVSSFNMDVSSAVSSTGTLGGASGAFNTRARVVCTVDCFVSFTAEYIAATSNGIFIPANVPGFFEVGGGKYAVGEANSAGTMYIDVLR